MRSKKVTTVLQNGSPYGIRISEMANWNGKIIIIPRSALKEVNDLEEAERPAAYILLSGDRREAYVGETEKLGDRLIRHYTKKEFWTDLIAFSGAKIGKAEARYLEYFFIQRLRDGGVLRLKNETNPKLPNIQKEDLDVLDEYVDRASDVLLTLGIDLFGIRADLQVEAKESGVQVLCKSEHADARAVYGEKGLLVLKDSIAKEKEAKSLQEWWKALRQQLLDGGILRREGKGRLVFKKDYLFASASAGASVVLARSANGLTEWKTEEGKTLKDLEKKAGK
jgi:hypothetical protein